MFEKYNNEYTNKLNINIKDIVLSKAIQNDSVGISKIIAERSTSNYQDYIEKIESEIEKNKNTLFVAKYKNEVIGFGRVSKLDKLEDYDLPNGYYLMGIIISKKYRRLGVGNALTIKRIEHVKEKENNLYFIVNSNNRVSIEFHEKLGFKLLKESITFPNVTFSGGGKGLLFGIELNSERL